MCIRDSSRKTPCICKVAPNSHKYYMEDVHRAGGIPAILGELDRGGLLSRDVHAVHADSLDTWLGAWDIRSGRAIPEAIELFHAAPGGVRTTEAVSSTKRWPSLDTDSESGCIRATTTPYTLEGGLAVLYGNLAPDGAIVKTAGVSEDQWTFRGTARVSESQEAAVDAILGGKITAGDVVVVRYEGPKGGPGMQEMLYPTSYLKAVGLGPQCALITDGRFSGGSSGLSIGHVSPEAAAGGAIGLIEDGDEIARSRRRSRSTPRSHSRRIAERPAAGSSGRRQVVRDSLPLPAGQELLGTGLHRRLVARPRDAAHQHAHTCVVDAVVANDLLLRLRRPLERDLDTSC